MQSSKKQSTELTKMDKISPSYYQVTLKIQSSGSSNDCISRERFYHKIMRRFNPRHHALGIYLGGEIIMQMIEENISYIPSNKCWKVSGLFSLRLKNLDLLQTTGRTSFTIIDKHIFSADLIISGYIEYQKVMRHEWELGAKKFVINSISGHPNLKVREDSLGNKYLKYKDI
ncbi:U2 protein [Tibrovirus congo]|uniref:U2 protein n=1 Tax=Tibrovirus congo TaxID=1987017 RepID=K0A197_9RHAB|nr:U2 protein [Tibrovirus congo]AFS65341.1 U2 protein [Tibrovirus congo]